MAGAGMEGLRDQGMALLQEIIRRKRLGLILDGEEIGALVRALATGHASDAQAGAFAMAVCLRGMSEAETVLLTLAMRDSGRVLAWDELPGPALDKHSTGGIGDKVSLVLAPIVAACGGGTRARSGARTEPTPRQGTPEHHPHPMVASTGAGGGSADGAIR
jgi:thymidine phosphorylase